MAEHEPSDMRGASRLDALLARFLTSVESGEPLDRQSLLREHPEFSEELRRFFEDHDRLQDAVAQRPTWSLAPHDDALAAGVRPLDETLPTHGPGPVDSTFALTDANRRFGDYELLHEIDRGGMGVIYRARHLRLNRTVALKMIKSGQLASDEEIQRFHAEAEAAAALDHPGIVPVYEAGEIGGLHYFSMAFVEGKSLASLVEQGPLAARDAAAIVKKAAQAVAYAHTYGVIHRDLKPGNILLDAQGEPKITDFGLAKNLHRQAKWTTTGQILGTPSYMAPEQARTADREITAAVDIYALGAVLYALCTGRPPHEASTTIDLLLQVLEREPTAPSKINRRVPRELEQICLKCLEKNPTDRYESAAALAADLDRFLKGEPVEGCRRTWHVSLRRWFRREPALAVHLSGILTALVILCGVHVTLGSDFWYFVQHANTLLAWSLACWAMQQLANRWGMNVVIRVLWGSLDVLAFTFILWIAGPPRGPLLIGYAVLLAASGAFLRVRFVLFMTVVSILAYWGLTVVTWEDAEAPLSFVIMHAGGLAILGGLIAVQVRRLRKLSQYYEAQ